MAAAARAAQVQPAISCAAPLSVGDLVAKAARAAQVQPAIGELTPLAQPFAAPVTGDALMERAGHLVTHTMQAASAHTSEFQLPAAQLATCCAPVEGRATMDYDAIELADDGLRRQFGYLRLQCGRRLCKQSQEHAGHTHNRFSSYINGFSEDGQGWFPSEPGSCWLLLAAADCWLLLAAAGCWLLLAAGCCWLLAAGRCWLLAGCWLLLAAGSCWLAAGCSWLRTAAGCWLLAAAGCWLLLVKRG